MMIYKLSTGDELHRYHKSLVLKFNGNRRVLSTAVLNGGYKDNLKYVFNHDCNPGAGIACTLKTGSYLEDMKLTAGELGLPVEYTAGISTAASMDNVSIKEREYRDIKVTAIVTGGIEVNGGRVGDPASTYEDDGKWEKIKPGTINIMLFINCKLPEHTMARALVTCTEAKTAAIQELMQGSHYSRGLATGSGTDGTIVISNSDSSKVLTNAGKHCKLGELIGLVVKDAVKEALYLQTGLCPEEQHSVLRRCERFGINESTIWERYTERRLEKLEFINNLHVLDTSDDIVAPISLCVHLMDQLMWGLIKGHEAVREAGLLLNTVAERFGVEKTEYKIGIDGSEEAITFIISAIEDLLVKVSGGN